MNELTGWIVFATIVMALLALDLGVFHRRSHTVSMREAIGWSIFWVVLSLLFNLGLYFARGAEQATEFLTGYIVEKSLSVDNLFVISVIFTYFKVPSRYQHKVLFWGILGALLTRGVFVVLGVEMMHRFAWTTYVLGAFLVYTGVKLLSPQDDSEEVGNNAVVRFAQKHMRFTSDYVGDKFLARVDGRWLGTPLLLVVLVIETTDVLFAVDSVPAVLGITTNAFVVYTSNVFAILGLRALYFVLADAVLRFHFMKHGLCLILSFVGVKMIIAPFYHIPTYASLGVILATLLVTATMSIIVERHLDAERSRWRKEHALAGVEVVREEVDLAMLPGETVGAAGKRVMEDIEKLMLLHTVPCFRSLSFDELRPLADDLHLQRVRAGEFVCRQGEPGEAVFVVVEGEVVVERARPDGETLLVATLGPNQHVGEMSLFDGGARSASVRATQDCLLLALMREPFLQVSRRHPQILVEIIRILSGRLRTADTLRVQAEKAAGMGVPGERSHQGDASKA